jgi:hypothetical protein
VLYSPTAESIVRPHWVRAGLIADTTVFHITLRAVAQGLTRDVEIYVNVAAIGNTVHRAATLVYFPA